MKRFFKGAFGYPKFKSNFDKNSYSTTSIYKDYKDKRYHNIEVDLTFVSYISISNNFHMKYSNQHYLRDMAMLRSHLSIK